jgi:hypothetical protein
VRLVTERPARSSAHNTAGLPSPIRYSSRTPPWHRRPARTRWPLHGKPALHNPPQLPYIRLVIERPTRTSRPPRAAGPATPQPSQLAHARRVAEGQQDRYAAGLASAIRLGAFCLLSPRDQPETAAPARQDSPAQSAWTPAVLPPKVSRCQPPLRGRSGQHNPPRLAPSRLVAEGPAEPVIPCTASPPNSIHHGSRTSASSSKRQPEPAAHYPAGLANPPTAARSHPSCRRGLVGASRSLRGRRPLTQSASARVAAGRSDLGARLVVQSG